MNPDGVVNCRTYQLDEDATETDKPKCIECDADHYLADNKCVAVVNNINNCKYYSSANTCSLCKDTYLIKEESNT